jgi:hypothetical protein
MQKMNIKMVMAISATILASCSTMENVTKVENKRTLILDKSLNVSYRIITQQLQKCLSPEFKGNLYPDTQTARIFISDHGFVGNVHDLKAIDENHTELNYFKSRCAFCTNAEADRHIEKIKVWVNNENTGCEAL